LVEPKHLAGSTCVTGAVEVAALPKVAQRDGTRLCSWLVTDDVPTLLGCHELDEPKRMDRPTVLVADGTDKLASHLFGVLPLQRATTNLAMDPDLIVEGESLRRH
jgi:hypothetical protein